MRLSKNLRQIFVVDEHTVTIEELLERLRLQSFGVILILLALPSALPIPLPGYATPFGLALLGIGVQIMLRRDHPWVPQAVGRRELHPKHDSKLIRGMIDWLAYAEQFIRPRYRWVYTHDWAYRALGMLIVVCSISIIFPMPLTNGIPAVGVFLIGLGMLEEDGVAAAVGVVVSAIGLIIASIVIGIVAVLGWEALDRAWVYAWEWVAGGVAPGV